MTADSPPDKDAQRRVQIRIPKQYRDIDTAVWKDLEEYLFTGFLSSHANLLGQSFVFKTLNHLEIRNIEYVRPPKSDSSQAFKAAFIAYSLLVAMGRNVLAGRSGHLHQLCDMVAKVPSVYQDKILTNLNALNSKAHKLYPLVEVYVHESKSRYKWLFLKKLAVHSSEATGIQGTSELGMNYCQQAWVAMNEAIDRKEEIESDWNHAKFVGSCFAGKGMISIEEQDKARKSREKQEMEENKMRVLREYVDSSFGKQIDSNQGTVSLPDGRRAVVTGRFKAETAEELADQLSSALSGEKDWHDRAIESYFRRVQSEREAVAKESRQLAAMPPRLAQAGRSAAGVAKVLDREDADEYLKRMQALMIRPPAGPAPPPDIDVDRAHLRGKPNE
jgi:hypothetical protein